MGFTVYLDFMTVWASLLSEENCADRDLVTDLGLLTDWASLLKRKWVPWSRATQNNLQNTLCAHAYLAQIFWSYLLLKGQCTDVSWAFNLLGSQANYGNTCA